MLAGKNAKTGPNLYGMPGRVAGTYPEFKYGKSIVAVGAAGYVWDEAGFVEYVQDPAKFLKAKLGDDKAKSKMAFKLKKPEDAANVWAFIASLSPAAAAADAAAAPAEGTATETAPVDQLILSICRSAIEAPGRRASGVFSCPQPISPCHRSGAAWLAVPAVPLQSARYLWTPGLTAGPQVATRAQTLLHGT
ncbi:MAG: hypothetical protein U5J82_15750 [Desulfobacterales bacterium]|nr:hypothetical protein [Desulfobacterales bacterium]